MENAEHFTGHANTDIIIFPQALPYSARFPLSASVTLLLSQLNHSAPACSLSSTPEQQHNLVLRIRDLKSLGKLASVETRFETCKTDLDSYLCHLLII